MSFLIQLPKDLFIYVCNFLRYENILVLKSVNKYTDKFIYCNLSLKDIVSKDIYQNYKPVNTLFLYLYNKLFKFFYIVDYEFVNNDVFEDAVDICLFHYNNSSNKLNFKWSKILYNIHKKIASTVSIKDFFDIYNNLKNKDSLSILNNNEIVTIIMRNEFYCRRNIIIQELDTLFRTGNTSRWY